MHLGAQGVLSQAFNGCGHMNCYMCGVDPLLQLGVVPHATTHVKKEEEEERERGRGGGGGGLGREGESNH